MERLALTAVYSTHPHRCQPARPRDPLTEGRYTLRLRPSDRAMRALTRRDARG